MAEIKGKRVFIIGGSSGIGRALAMEFAGKGAVLAIASRGKDNHFLFGVGRLSKPFGDNFFP